MFDGVSYLLRLLFFGLLLCAASSLSAQTLILTDERLLAEGAHKCGYWQLLLLSYRAEEGIEGTLILTVGTVKFRERITAPAHSEGVVRIPFFLPYPDAPMRLVFVSEQEEIHFPEAVKRIRELMGTSAARLSGCFGETPIDTAYPRALIDPTLLEDSIYLTQFDILVFSTVQRGKFSKEAERAIDEFVNNGGSVIEFERKENEEWELMEKKSVGAGLLVRVSIPDGATAEQSRELIREIETGRRMATPLEHHPSGIKAIPPPPYTDASPVWFILTITFAASLGYIALTLRLHPRLFRISLPILLPALFSLFILLSPPASVWLVEAEVVLKWRSQGSDGSFGVVQKSIFVGSYAKTVWSPQGLPPFIIPVDSETGRTASINAVYEAGIPVELELDRTPRLLVKTGVYRFTERQTEGSITNITEQDWSKTYLFKGIWVFDYGPLRAGESLRLKKAEKKMSRSDAFSEIMESAGLDVRNFVRNRDRIVALSGTKRLLANGVRHIITPQVVFIGTD